MGGDRREIILFRIDRKTAILMMGVLAVFLAGFALSEQLTLTTSYPVPVGIYNKLITTGDSGAAPADTTFNRNAGNTILVPPTNAGGKVGIGTTTPAAKLDVVGAANDTTWGFCDGWWPVSSANMSGSAPDSANPYIQLLFCQKL